MENNNKKLTKTLSLISKVALVYFIIKFFKQAVAKCKDKCKK